MTDRQGPAESTDVTERLPTERLAQEAQNFLNALAEKALESISERLSQTTDQLVDYMEHGGPGIKSAISGLTALVAVNSPFRVATNVGATGLKEKVKQTFGRGGGGKKGLKLTNIVEQTDVGVPIHLAYDQWTQFKDFPSFMKKVESAEQEADEKINWKAQIWWSHRNWESTIIEQVPDDHIVWRSKGPKGYIDGVVTFSELAPNLTRILLDLEYHPQGFFEHTGNLWRAQGRRARLELKHFRRHVMAHTILQPDEIEGWRGEIRDGEVVKTHEEALEEEALDRKQREAEGEPEGLVWKEEVAAEKEEDLAARKEEEPADEDRELAGDGDEFAEGEVPEAQEARTPTVGRPAKEAAEAEKEGEEPEPEPEPEARRGAKKEVRRRRPPA
ncbi:MAG: SRPBCC family protein [Actinomadura sp.]